MKQNLKLLVVAGSALAIVACNGGPASLDAKPPRQWQAAQGEPFTCPPPMALSGDSQDPRPECPRMPGRQLLV